MQSRKTGFPQEELFSLPRTHDSNFLFAQVSYSSDNYTQNANSLPRAAESVAWISFQTTWTTDTKGLSSTAAETPSPETSPRHFSFSRLSCNFLHSALFRNPASSKRVTAADLVRIPWNTFTGRREWAPGQTFRGVTTGQGSIEFGHFGLDVNTHYRTKEGTQAQWHMILMFTREW